MARRPQKCARILSNAARRWRLVGEPCVTARTRHRPELTTFCRPRRDSAIALPPRRLRQVRLWITAARVATRPAPILKLS